jgi:ribosome-associated protein
MSKIILPASDDDLLAECDFEAFRSSGSGGQSVNKTSSAVRLRHRPTGLSVVCQQERSQYLNKMICLEKLREKVAKLNYRPPKRILTKLPLSAKKERLEKKSKRSQVKKLRSPPCE